MGIAEKASVIKKYEQAKAPALDQKVDKKISKGIPNIIKKDRGKDMGIGF